MDSPTQLKQKHDLRAASLGEALWPPADAKTLFEHSCRTRDTFNKYQVERGIFKLMPIGDAYTPTDKMHWRAVRSHYNLFGRPPSLALLIPAVLAGAGLPLVSLLKVAPAAVRATADYGLSPDLPVAQITNLVAYLSAGAIIGYLLDHNTLVWTFLLTYIAAHAVLGWTFGIVPYSIIAGMASYYAGQAKKRRRLILIEARG